MPTPADPPVVLRSRQYIRLLLLAAILGAPIPGVVAWGFLALVSQLQQWQFTSLPKGLGSHGEPTWWPLPLVALAGVLVSLAIKYLPGTGGHSTADGLKPGAPTPAEIPGVLASSRRTLPG